MAKSSRFALAVALAAAMAAATAAFGAVGPLPGAQGSTVDPAAAERAAYVATIEPICHRNAKANDRLLKNVRRKAERGYIRVAARQFSRASRAFRRALRQINRVPRPASDRPLLDGWVRTLKRQPLLLTRISKALRREFVFRANALGVRLKRNARRANTQVRGFGFEHCLLHPSEFL